MTERRSYGYGARGPVAVIEYTVLGHPRQWVVEARPDDTPETLRAMFEAERQDAFFARAYIPMECV